MDDNPPGFAFCASRQSLKWVSALARCILVRKFISHWGRAVETYRGIEIIVTTYMTTDTAGHAVTGHRFKAVVDGTILQGNRQWIESEIDRRLSLKESDDGNKK